MFHFFHFEHTDLRLMSRTSGQRLGLARGSAAEEVCPTPVVIT